MDPSHFIVGGLTAVAFAWLVWAEIRSRRNIAAQPEQQSVPGALGDVQPAPNKKRRRR